MVLEIAPKDQALPAGIIKGPANFGFITRATSARRTSLSLPRALGGYLVLYQDRAGSPPGTGGRNYTAAKTKIEKTHFLLIQLGFLYVFKYNLVFCINTDCFFVCFFA